MNCAKSRKMILLKDAGELDAKRCHELDGHLAACSECRDFFRDMVSLRSIAHSAVRSGEPSARVVEAVLSTAPIVKNRPGKIFALSFTRFAALAAGFVLLVGGALIIAPWNRNSDASSSSAGDVSTIVAMLSVEHENSSTAPENGNPAQLRQLARQLLEMEGMNAGADDESPEFILLFEPQPTDLQSRSISGSLPGECV